MATLKGRAVIWSIGGITFSAGIVSSTDPEFMQSARFSRTSDMGEIRDDGGIIRSVAFHGFKKSLSITCVPAGAAASLATAFASNDAHLPVAGTTVTVVDASGAIVDGNWNVVSCNQNRSIDGPATVDIELMNGDEGLDLTVATTA